MMTFNAGSSNDDMKSQYLLMAKKFGWSTAKFNSNNDIDANVDDESTESDDNFECQKHVLTDPNNQINAENTSFAFSTPIKKFDKQLGSAHNLSIQQPTSAISPLMELKSNGNSLKLTEQNLSAFNLSMESNKISNRNNDSLSSTSSVLSKHNFTLLEISDSDSDSHISSSSSSSSSIEIIENKKPSIINNKILCDTILSPSQFKKERNKYTDLFFIKLNKIGFDNKLKLNDNITYSWCKTLNKTAGDCRLILRNRYRIAHVRLATKVLDTLEKLKQTFCHELCHAMAWIVNNQKKPPHGKYFKYWANQAECRFDDIKVTTCHSYTIQFKFKWQCTQCTYIYGRHSKSIKPDKHRCGLCKGTLKFMGRVKPDGSIVKPKKRAPTAYSVFMKKHMGTIKKEYPGASHGDVMRILAKKYKLSKQTSDFK